MHHGNAHDRLPSWLNLDAFVDDKITTDLAAVRAEAEGLASTVRDFAIRAFRATQAWDAAVAKANPTDDVWELAKHAHGAEATFEAIACLIANLELTRLEWPEDPVPDWIVDEAVMAPQTAFTKSILRKQPPAATTGEGAET